MHRGQTVGVVVPAYNEEPFVGDVIETIPEFVDRVYVVDDCSTDDTWAAIRRRIDGRDVSPADDRSSVATAVRRGSGPPLEYIRVGSLASAQSDDDAEAPAAFEERLVAVRHVTNAGVGGAITTGYRCALADDIDVTAVMSGDGQMEPAILDRILAPVVRGEAAYSKGNRLRYGEYRREMSRWRTFGNYLLTYLTRIASGYWGMMDPQNGYTAVSKAALETVDLDSLYQDYGFCNDLLVRLNTHGFTVADVPMRAVYGDETSHIRYSRFVPSLSLLLLRSYLRRLVHRNVRRESPATVAFQLLGIATLTLSAVLGAGTLLAAVVPSPAVPTGTVGVAVSSVAGGVAFLGGVVADKRRSDGLEISIDPADLPLESGGGPDVGPPSEDTPGGS
jgi:glycosyltransferase involved in cell wall biosynthesis